MIKSTGSISLKLVRISVSVAVLLGILMSFGELFIDLENQKNQSKTSIGHIVNTVTPLASKVAYELNEYSAEDVITGLFAYPIILSAEILGDRGQVMASRERLIPHSQIERLLNWAFVDIESIHTELIHENYNQSVGELVVTVDITQFSQQVIERFFTSLMFGILRNIALAIVLLFFFQRFLTKPILSISENLAGLDSRSIEYLPIPSIKQHEEDELGGLIESINRHLSVKTEVGQQLRRSQRIQSLGQLTGGIAHDFNNILGIVLGNLELLHRRVVKDEQAFSYVTEALNGVKRGRELTRKLLNYARSDRGNEARIQIDEVVAGISELITRSLTLKTVLEISLGEGIWAVNANPGDLQDAILNLALNARDAINNGGKIFIEVSNKTLDQDYTQLNPNTKAGDYVMVSVSDTGVGMSAEVVESAVEPFFTTKREGDGTGLGLSMVYGFIRRSGGSLKLYSEVGVGTTVRLYLPRAEGDVEPHQKSKELLVLPQGVETILVVDDELALTNLAAENLRSLGYNAVCCASGENALKILEDGLHVDLLFTDVIMPGGMDGYELSLQARKKFPDLKILVTSGYTKKREEYVNGERDFLNNLVADLLNKPYSKRELAYSVRRALDEE